MNVTFRQLKVFVAITQEGSLTAASGRLHLTKSAISMALSELERQLGRRLFDRANKQLILNEQGRRLLPLADELLDRAAAISQIFEADDATNGNLRLGSSYTIGNHLLPTLLGDFRRDTGYLHQSLMLSNSTKTCRMLLDFELDLGFIEAKIREKKLKVEPWMSDEMVIVRASTGEQDRGAPQPLSILEGKQWVLREPGSGTREFFYKEIGSDLNEWVEAFELNSTTAIVNAVAAGLGHACLSKRSVVGAVADGRLEVIALQKPLQRQFSLVYNTEKYQSPVFKSFKDYAHKWALGKD
ncbi:LysR substrate-binding domain-containing protein [Pseudovibrio sp. Tun.PSC04-5.I4]|uniref:LysR substrate-binding domain-containing protein n=1 Tax=Pseudovibrio sp. Tun.PSC04-5.I4 TaxID=1798213 RepID=UPI000886567B|nr:LysR substrate-binding domain-containing protein [Pseudovibrio sp. Tun.PSC04-5.I4]SDQ23886.1 DNA-binding transcriptional regulator, LysR family [Pseudovibrio sp. Tun.PSC04-5.I4]